MNKNFHNDDKFNKSNDKLRPDIYNDELDFDVDNETTSDDLLIENNETKENINKEEIRNVPSSKKKKFIFKKFLCFIIIVFAVVVIFSLAVPSKTTFLILATDQDGTRTDTIMYGVFNKWSKDISLLSIPRDTYVTVDDDVYAKMNEQYPQPGSKSMKINAVHHFGGEKYGTELILNQVEKLTGNEIDFYVKVNFSTFRYIIDAVGGIDFYVPQNMEYHDPLQNLHISLAEGQQRLTGQQAEQVLRYRSGYANADLGRVDVQQQFMKAFISQVFSKRNIISKPMVFVSLLTNDEYIDTNFGPIDAITYLLSIIGLDTSSMESETLPGTAGYAAGQSVYFYDEEECKNILAEMMK